MTIFEINNLLIKLANQERKMTKEILNHIAQLYRMDGHKKLGYASIIDYLKRGLGYSDDAAYRRWKAAKLLLQIPELGEQIASGNLNLSQTAQVQKAVEAIKKEEDRNVSIAKQKEILSLIANKNNFDTQKIIAEKLEIKPKIGDSAKPQSDNTVRLDMQLTSQQYEKFLKIKSLLSHQVPDQKNGDVLEILFDLYLNKKLGNQKQEIQTQKRSQEKQEVQTQQKSHEKQEIQKQQIPQKRGQLSSAHSFMLNRSNFESEAKGGCKSSNNNNNINIYCDAMIGNKINHTKKSRFGNNHKLKLGGEIRKQSRHIPANIRRQIYTRANCKCENFDPKTGLECGSSYKLQIDHIQPLALGGQTEIGNLRLLCSLCNAMAARSLGIGYETTSYFTMV